MFTSEPDLFSSEPDLSARQKLIAATIANPSFLPTLILNKKANPLLPTSKLINKKE